MISELSEVTGDVPFPEHTDERAYMVPFRIEHGLPDDLSRWQPTVDAMTNGVVSSGKAYVMIDQGEVGPSAAHRRGGLHIDGNWVEEISAHSPPVGRWDVLNDEVADTLILASDVSACRAVLGDFEGKPAPNGDCSHIDASGGMEMLLEANKAYVGNAVTMHESIPAEKIAKRSLVRINIPARSAKRINAPSQCNV